ncbi:MAG TPA: hypothetical protein PLI95_01290 [Polyangiaceae bacterium]|nr:hypothetical protein [Polyangiaceae bacterium]
MSRRQQKKVIAQGVRALRATPSWDPARHRPESTTERLRDEIERSRIGDALESASACEACGKRREETGDPGALCPDHLRTALGL